MLQLWYHTVQCIEHKTIQSYRWFHLLYMRSGLVFYNILILYIAFFSHLNFHRIVNYSKCGFSRHYIKHDVVTFVKWHLKTNQNSFISFTIIFSKGPHRERLHIFFLICLNINRSTNTRNWYTVVPALSDHLLNKKKNIVLNWRWS